MKNPVIFYVVIALGVISLAAGVFFLINPDGHHIRIWASLGVGIVLLIAGIAGMFMSRSKAIA
ncbi:MAG TPA: hypothetical protein VKR83_01150 [Ktedonobacteraceae bacterium]|nr:hypothetical protein [Ktedonobacteraceae bacterium]